MAKEAQGRTKVRRREKKNITSGIALVTSAPDAVRHFERTFHAQWDGAYKGADGARLVRRILDGSPN